MDTTKFGEKRKLSFFDIAVLFFFFFFIFAAIKESHSKQSFFQRSPGSVKTRVFQEVPAPAQK